MDWKWRDKVALKSKMSNGSGRNLRLSSGDGPVAQSRPTKSLPPRPSQLPISASAIMEDDELQAIRRARMQQLQQQGGGGGGAGSQGPSSSFLSQLGGKQGGGARRGAGDDDDDGGEGGQDQGQRMAQMEEQKRQMLSTILDSDARERRE